MTQSDAPAEIADLSSRYDFYGPVHKGLRSAQCALLGRLGSANFADADTSKTLVAEVRELLGLAAAHIEHEQQHVHNALRLRGLPVAERLDAQHDGHRRAFTRLEALLAEIEDAAQDARPALGRRLYLAWSLHVAHDLEHMFDEETAAGPLLWQHFTNTELGEIEGRIIGSLPPEQAMAFMRLMIPAVNAVERAAILDGMRQQAPREAFDAVIEFTARPNLSPGDFADLVARLGLAA